MTENMYEFTPPPKKATKDDQNNTSTDYSFIESVPDALLIHEDNGRIIAANKHACHSLGYSQAELLNLSMQDIEFPSFGTNEIDVTDCLLTGKGPITTKATYRRKDGSIFPVEIKRDILEQNNEGSLLISTIRDTGARPSRQRRLQDKRDLLRLIIDLGR
ncbi:MAG TPA: PAS domain S-box protein [Desulfobulbus sp.]|nr:PAS domain S-box protein [Desulfobulbus sp.]